MKDNKQLSQTPLCNVGFASCGTEWFTILLINDKKMRRDVFRGIADPTRREILNMIAHKALNINSVAGNFNLSRTAIGKHIRILSECGLVSIRERGRERYYEARLEKLNEVSDWIERYRKSWDEKFGYLEQYLSRMDISHACPSVTVSAKAGNTRSHGRKTITHF
jgi:DNA-binding transcriptional ArsR family regulator